MTASVHQIIENEYMKEQTLNRLAAEQFPQLLYRLYSRFRPPPATEDSL
jgi:hypothetical protein